MIVEIKNCKKAYRVALWLDEDLKPTKNIKIAIYNKFGENVCFLKKNDEILISEFCTTRIVSKKRFNYLIINDDDKVIECGGPQASTTLTFCTFS